MYLLSRVAFGLVRLAREKRILPRTKNSMFPWFAAVVWAVALYLFEYHSHTLQPSLRSSMTYLLVVIQTQPCLFVRRNFETSTLLYSNFKVS